MTPTVRPGPMALQPQAPAAVPAASQNLFEHIASHAQQGQPAVTPAQLGSSLLEKMHGFIERVQLHSGRSTAPAAPSSEGREAASTGDGRTRKSEPAPSNERPSTGQADFDRIINALGRSFDYGTEVAMVVRNSSQVSSSVNTLLRGQ